MVRHDHVYYIVPTLVALQVQALAAKRSHSTSRHPNERPTGSHVPLYCCAMPWVDCSELRYHCIKYPDIDLCPEAFAEGRFPPGCSGKDFVRIDRRTSGVSHESSVFIFIKPVSTLHVWSPVLVECVQRLLNSNVAERGAWDTHALRLV